MNSDYNIEEWASGTTRGRQVFNYNYRMLGTEIKGMKLVKVVTMQEGPDVTERVYLWQSKTDPALDMVRVSITERHNWRLAQESLRGHLDNSMRPNIPRGTKKLAMVGDVNVAGLEPQTQIPAAVSFVRGNVCVSVSSVGERNIDVSQIASSLDQALSASPPKGDVEKGKVLALRPTLATVKAKESHVLIENLKGAAPGGEWLKVIVPDGELSRKDDALTYVSPEGGTKEVGIFAVGGK